jgi:hypothetical protein
MRMRMTRKRSKDKFEAFRFSNLFSDFQICSLKGIAIPRPHIKAKWRKLWGMKPRA